MTRTMTTALFLGTLLFLFCGCSRAPVKIGELKTEKSVIKAGSAISIVTTIEIGVGKLVIKGGGAELMEGEFTYNVPDWKPLVDYRADDLSGALSVRQPPLKGAKVFGMERNDWTIRLTDSLPIDLNILSGVGESNLALGSLSLNSLNIKTGKGRMNVDLTGRPRVKTMKCSIGVGEVGMNLAGEWQESLTAHIEGGVGELKLALPLKTGVRLTVEKGVGKLDLRGFKEQDRTYINNAYGKSTTSLEIKIKAGVGNIIAYML